MNLIDKILVKKRIWMRRLQGQEFNPELDATFSTKRYGPDFGGWELIPEEVTADSIVYSFGVGEEISFDLDLIADRGVTIHAFDPTPKSLEWLKSQEVPKEFIMHPLGIASYDGEAQFNAPDNPDFVSHTMLSIESCANGSVAVPVKRLATIMKELGHDHIDILKIDIEGAEYDVIDDILKTDDRPRYFFVEFHHRFPEVGLKPSKRAIRQLRQAGYELFAVSSTKEEFCFRLKSS
ncbi:MAG: FkbM family methyltransferase [Verrucomicrobiota bacterium]